MTRPSRKGERAYPLESFSSRTFLSFSRQRARVGPIDETGIFNLRAMSSYVGSSLTKKSIMINSLPRSGSVAIASQTNLLLLVGHAPLECQLFRRRLVAGRRRAV